MALKKKISELPIWTDFTGLYTIGVNALGKSVRVSLAYIKEKIDAAIKATADANTAAGTANTAAAKADESRKLVEQVKQETIAAKNETIKATAAAKDATEKATTAAGTANTAATEATKTASTAAEQAEKKVNKAIGDLNDLIGRLKPESMSVKYPKLLTAGNYRLQKIEATLYPEGVPNNILYIAHNEDIMHVMPDGTIIPRGTGKCTIYVIPTENTSLYKAIEIEIKIRGIRMHAPKQIRFIGNTKNIRFN